jgi:hypothetical protein
MMGTSADGNERARRVLLQGRDRVCMLHEETLARHPVEACHRFRPRELS